MDDFYAPRITDPKPEGRGICEARQIGPARVQASCKGVSRKRMIETLVLYLIAKSISMNSGSSSAGGPHSS